MLMMYMWFIHHQHTTPLVGAEVAARQPGPGGTARPGPAGYSARNAVAVLVAAAQLAGSSAPATAITRPARASTAISPPPYTRRMLAGRPVLAAAAMTGST